MPMSIRKRIESTVQFRRDTKRAVKRGMPMEELDAIIRALCADEPR
ncbi:hypothetical protein AGMMS49992_32390 [Clostridia bacterium]|nr:hypothetical protein AGMMS49992_32390 [Clostridia bacterium]